MGVDALAAVGMLRAGDPDLHTATLALAMGFEPYILMIEDWRWPVERLHDWFDTTVRATVIQDRRSA